METILKQCSQDRNMVISVDIADVDGGAAALYVLNGGTRPPIPVVGDFIYDFSTLIFQVYYPNGWRTVTIFEVESMVYHPDGNPSIVSFTSKALPFWMPVTEEQEGHQCRFDNVHMLLMHFRQTFNAEKFNIFTLPSTSSLSHTKRRPDGLGEYYHVPLPSVCVSLYAS